MRRVWIGLVALMIVILAMAGCGSSDEEISETTAPSESSTTLTPSTETPTTQAPAGDSWETVATLNSTDAPWQGMEGILVSDPFTAAGEAQLVLDMPDAGELDGVIVAIIPADKATDPTTLMDAIQAGVIVTLPAALQTQAVSDLDGTYVLVNSVPQSIAWSVELQTRP